MSDIMENPPKLNEKQEKILSEVYEIMDNFEKEADSDLHAEKKDSIITFLHVMEGENLSIQDYVLGRRLMGNKNLTLDGAFDTPNQDIEKFIKNL